MVKINQLKQFVKAIILNEEYIPLFIWSPPGVGKSSAIKQVTDELGLDLIDLRLSLLNPVDLRGLPTVDKEKKIAEWLIPNFLPRSGKGVLFLDEMNLAPASVMAAAYQLILDRKLGEYHLPDGWKIIAAGNRAEDQAAVTKFPAPLANRFIHIELDSDVDEWVKWAFSAGIAEQVIAFIKKMPQHLFKMPKAGETRFPTPRSWEYASKLHQAGLGIESSVGDGTASEFNAFLNVYKDLPDVSAIVEGKYTKQVDQNRLDILWALSVSIAMKTNDKNFTHVFKYISQMPKEFEVLTVIGISNISKKLEMALVNSPEWKDWIRRNKDIIDSE